MEKNRKRIIIAFLAAVVIVLVSTGEQLGMAVIMSNQAEQGQLKFEENDIMSVQKLIGDEASVLERILPSYSWNSVFLMIPVFFVILLILNFGISIRRPENTEEDYIKKRKKWLFCVLRYVISLALLWACLTYGKNFWNDVPLDYVSELSSISNYQRWIISWLLLLIFIIDWKRLYYGVRREVVYASHKSTFIIMMTVSYLCMCLVELQCGSRMDIVPYMYIYNYIIWWIPQIMVWLICRNVVPGAILSLIMAWLIGFANMIVYQFRGNYIMFGDLTVVRTALEVVGNYRFSPDRYFAMALAICLISIGLLLRCAMIQKPKRNKMSAIRRIKEISAGETLLIVFVAMTYHTGILYHNINGIAWDYNTNVSYTGYIPYFLSNMNYQKRVVCEDYASEYVKEVLEAAVGQNNDLSQGEVYPDQPANIILIQNEAFSDLKVAYDLETNQDYFPFIHGMRENTIKGYMNLSVSGGPTSNTEFEVLSRSSMAFFPYGSVPYTQYLKMHIPSMVEVLKNQEPAYYTVAYHSYYSTGYNRKSAYNYIGFDQMEFEDNYLNEYPEKDLQRRLMSDEADYRKVIGFYEERKAQSPETPFFCFNVTMQNHGGYTGSYAFEDPVYVTNFDASESINTYLSLMKMSDQAFAGLVEYFSHISEPTIIMMYGDHQPSWDDDAASILNQHRLSGNNTRADQNLYYVPYIIWANYDIEEQDHMMPYGDEKLNEISANYAASVLMKYAGVTLSSYDEYLLKLHEKIPALTALGYWTADGAYQENIDLGPYSEELSDLKKIQYQLLFDEKEKAWNLYK